MDRRGHTDPRPVVVPVDDRHWDVDGIAPAGLAHLVLALCFSLGRMSTSTGNGPAYSVATPNNVSRFSWYVTRSDGRSLDGDSTAIYDSVGQSAGQSVRLVV